MDLTERYGEKLNVVHIDVRMEPLLMARHNVRFIPTFILYDNAGKEVGRRLGDLKPEEVAKLVGK